MAGRRAVCMAAVALLLMAAGCGGESGDGQTQAQQQTQTNGRSRTTPASRATGLQRAMRSGYLPNAQRFLRQTLHDPSIVLRDISCTPIDADRSSCTIQGIQGSDATATIEMEVRVAPDRSIEARYTRVSDRTWARALGVR